MSLSTAEKSTCVAAAPSGASTPPPLFVDAAAEEDDFVSRVPTADIDSRLLTADSGRARGRPAPPPVAKAAVEKSPRVAAAPSVDAAPEEDDFVSRVATADIDSRLLTADSGRTLGRPAPLPVAPPLSAVVVVPNGSA
jgi:hypothetical protein